MGKYWALTFPALPVFAVGLSAISTSLRHFYSNVVASEHHRDVEITLKVFTPAIGAVLGLSVPTAIAQGVNASVAHAGSNPSLQPIVYRSVYYATLIVSCIGLLVSLILIFQAPRHPISNWSQQHNHHRLRGPRKHSEDYPHHLPRLSPILPLTLSQPVKAAIKTTRVATNWHSDPEGAAPIDGMAARARGSLLAAPHVSDALRSSPQQDERQQELHHALSARNIAADAIIEDSGTGKHNEQQNGTSQPLPHIATLHKDTTSSLNAPAHLPRRPTLPALQRQSRPTSQRATSQASLHATADPATATTNWLLDPDEAGHVLTTSPPSSPDDTSPTTNERSYAQGSTLDAITSHYAHHPPSQRSSQFTGISSLTPTPTRTASESSTHTPSAPAYNCAVAIRATTSPRWYPIHECDAITYRL